MAAEDRGRWLQVMLIYALSVFAVMVISEAAPVLGGVARELHPRSGAAIGWVMSIPALVAAVSALLVGGVVDRVGDRRVLLAGAVILICGDLGVVAAHSLPVLLAWRMVGGLGYVCMAVAAVTLVTRLTEGRQRTAALALWSTVIPASFIVSFLASGLLAGLGQWRAIFLLHAGVSAGLLVLGALALPGGAPQAGPTSRLSGVMEVLRSPWPYALGLSFAFDAFLQTGMVAGLAPLLGLRIGATEAQVQPFTLLTMLLNMAGALAVAPMLNRGVAAWAVAVGAIAVCAASGLGLLFAPLTLGSALALDCAVMLGCGVLVGLWALLPQVAPSFRTIGATSGLITQITLLGVLFGPPAVFAGLTQGRDGLLVFLLMSLAGCFAGLPVWLRSGAKASGRGAVGLPQSLRGGFH